MESRNGLEEVVEKHAADCGSGKESIWPKGESGIWIILMISWTMSGASRIEGLLRSPE